MPCRMTGPVVEQFSQKHGSLIDVYKLNVDENQSLAGQLGIMSIPTLIAVQDGKIQKTLIGFRPLGEMEKELRSLVGQS